MLTHFEIISFLVTWVYIWLETLVGYECWGCRYPGCFLITYQGNWHTVILNYPFRHLFFFFGSSFVTSLKWHNDHICLPGCSLGSCQKPWQDYLNFTQCISDSLALLAFYPWSLKHSSLLNNIHTTLGRFLHDFFSLYF